MKDYFNSKTIKTFTNTIKKNNYLDLLIDFYSMIFSTGLCIAVIRNLWCNCNFDSNIVYYNALLYFIVTTIHHGYNNEILYLIHHCVSLLGLFLNYFNNNIIFNRWVNICYLSEISTIFLCAMNILKKLRDNYNIFIEPIYFKYCMYLFGSLYFMVRIAFVVPYTIYFMKENFHIIKYNYLTVSSIFIMFCLYTYWAFVILNRGFLRNVNKKNKLMTTKSNCTSSTLKH